MSIRTHPLSCRSIGQRRAATLVAFVLVVLSQHAALAQNLKVSALVDETTIGSEERLTYTIEVQGSSLPDIRTPQPPETKGLVLANRYPSSARNISVVNGSMTVSMSYSWQFTPTSTGKATIGESTIVAGGKTYKTDPVDINVVPQASRPARPQARQPRSLFDEAFGDDQPAPELNNSDLFIRARPSKRNAYQNEQVLIEYDLYFRSGVQLRQSRLADSWDAEGFWREELDVESRPVPRTVVENGIRYNVITLKRVAVFPTRTGELTVDALKIESEATSGSRDPFFSLRSRYQPVELSSRPVTIVGKSFPDGAPAAFNGAVGSFRLNAELNRSEVEVGESVELTVTISGTGNIATLEGPTLDAPGVFETYDPQVSTDVSRSGNSVRGTKTFTYILVPRTNGTFEIPEIRFAFLNPTNGRYESVSSGPFSVTVTGEAPVTGVTAATSAGLPVDDIPPIAESASDWVRANRRAVHRSALVWTFLLLPALALLGIAAYRGFNEKLASDVTYARGRKAHPVARKHLKAAAELLQAGDAKGYYGELDRALLGFIGNRLNVGERALTREQLDATLADAGIERDIRAGVMNLLDECDHVRFAPTPPNTSQMQTAMERASFLIEKIHERLTALAREAKQ